MTKLAEAIYAAFTNDPGGEAGLNALLGGRLYLEEAPENPDFPYGTFRASPGVPFRDFAVCYEGIIVVFDLFSRPTNDAPAEIFTLFEALKTLYDSTTLASLEDFKLIQFTRQSAMGPLHVEGTWQYSVSYKVDLEPA